MIGRPTLSGADSGSDLGDHAAVDQRVESLFDDRLSRVPALGRSTPAPSHPDRADGGGVGRERRGSLPRLQPSRPADDALVLAAGWRSSAFCSPSSGGGAVACSGAPSKWTPLPTTVRFGLDRPETAARERSRDARAGRARRPPARSALARQERRRRQQPLPLRRGRDRSTDSSSPLSSTRLRLPERGRPEAVVRAGDRSSRACGRAPRIDPAWFAEMLIKPSEASKAPEGAAVKFSFHIGFGYDAGDDEVRDHPTHGRDRGLEQRDIDPAASARSRTAR